MYRKKLKIEETCDFVICYRKAHILTNLYCFLFVHQSLIQFAKFCVEGKKKKKSLSGLPFVLDPLDITFALTAPC